MLGDICQIAMGQSPSSDTYTMNKAGVPFFQGNADFGEENPIPRIWCNKPIKIANENDILISVRAPIGSINIANSKCCIGRGLAKITPNTCVYLRYLIWFLRSRTKFLQDHGTGTTFKAINKKQLETLPISLPSVNEQMQIGQVLDKLSSLINLKKKQYRVLDKLVKSQFNELFLLCRNFKKVCELCLNIVDCPHSTPKYDEDNLIYPAIRTSEIVNGCICWETMKYVGENEYKTRTKRLIPQPGDIVYAREGTYGDCVIIPDGFYFCLGQRTMLFRPDNKLCTSEYLHQALRSNAVKRQADSFNTGSTVPHVNVSDAKNFKIPFPTIEQQEKFSNIVRHINKSKFVVQQSIEKLELLKKSLMQQYFG